MARLLKIDSSPRNARSHTRRLTGEFVKTWQRHHPADTVISRDVGLQPPPPVDESWIAAAFCPAAERTEEMRAALSLSEELVDELLRTDVLVMGVPMYNFGIPATLKAYIDQVVRIGRTFAFEPQDAAQPYKPLTHGKRAFVIVSSGDAGYDAGQPLAGLNQVEPYLRTVLDFIGLRQIDFVYVGNDEFGGERLERSIASGFARVAQLAAASEGELGKIGGASKPAAGSHAPSYREACG